MTSERIKEIQQQTAYPDSVSVQQALLQVWNECSTSSQTENGSKDSDECQFEPISKTTSVTICANCGKEKFLHNTTTSYQTTSDKWKEYQEWLNEVPEISDEEIEKGAEEKYPYNKLIDGDVKGMLISAKKNAWVDAIKWYKEQLKTKQ